MYVHLPSKSLILKLQDPSAVTGHIPRSRVINYKGAPLTQVHLGIDEMRVLRNLGFKAPSPIEYSYDWRRNERMIPAPFSHQRVTAAFFTLNSRAICLNDMGTGKTLSALWAADYLMDQGTVRRCIIVTPRSTMHSVWENEVLTHFMFNRKVAVLYGDKARRLKALEQDVDFYVINHDGLKTIEKELRARPDINLWILDEAAQGWRNAQTARYKLTQQLIRPTDWVWLMTGTPCPNAPTDAWALARLMGSRTVPKYFTAFKEDVMMQITPYKWVPRAGAYDKVYQILQPGIRFKKEDCLDLPPVTFSMRECDLTADQRTAYKEMHHKLVTSISGQQITAANAAVKLSKLLQVTTGAVYGNDGSTQVLDASNRLALTEEICEEAANKVIVFVPFKAALAQVAAHLSKRWTVESVSGDTSDTERKRIFAAFQQQDEPRILVAHPGTTAHGLTLTRADTTVWYAPIFSLEIFEQANNRMNRPGQKHPMHVALISSTPLEDGIYAALERKGNMQNSVLEMYKKEAGIT